MVRIADNKLIIELTTAAHPANEYTELVSDIIEAIECTDREMNTSNNYNALLGLLKELMPTYDQARSMLDN